MAKYTVGETTYASMEALVENKEDLKKYLEGTELPGNKKDLETLWDATYKNFSGEDYEGTEKILDKITKELNGYTVSVLREKDPSTGRLGIAKYSEPAKAKNSRKKPEKKEEEKETEPEETPEQKAEREALEKQQKEEEEKKKKEEEEKAKEEALKKAKKEKAKFWNTLSNGFMFALFASALLCAFGLGIVGMPLMMASFLGFAVTKGIAYQGGFNISKEDLANLNSPDSSNELTLEKELQKEYSLSNKQMKENNDYKQRVKDIKTQDEEIAKLRDKLQELENNGLGNSKEAETIKKDIAKKLNKKQKLQDKNQEFLDKAPINQLLSLKGKAPTIEQLKEDPTYVRDGFGDEKDEVYQAMIRNTFKYGLETSEKKNSKTKTTVQKTELSDETKVALSEMNQNERAQFLYDLEEYRKEQTSIIQATQRYQILSPKKNNVEKYNELKAKDPATLNEKEKAKLKELESIISAAGGIDKYFTAEEKSRLDRDEKVLLDAHDFKVNEAGRYETSQKKKDKVCLDIRNDAERTQNAELLTHLKTIDTLKTKAPRTEKEERDFKAAIGHLDKLIDERIKEEIQIRKKVSMGKTKRDLDALKATYILVKETADAIDSRENAREQIIRIEDEISLNPKLTKEDVESRLTEITTKIESLKKGKENKQQEAKIEKELKELEKTKEALSKKDAEIKQEKDWENMSDSEKKDLAKSWEEKLKDSNLSSDERKKIEEKLRKLKKKNKLLFKIQEYENGEAVVEDLDLTPDEKEEYDNDENYSVKIVKENKKAKEKEDEKKKNKKNKQNTNASGTRDR